MSKVDPLLPLTNDSEASPNLDNDFSNNLEEEEKSVENALICTASLQNDASNTEDDERYPFALASEDVGGGKNKIPNSTFLTQRISSPDRLRMKTYRLQKQLNELLIRHNTRHERLQSIKARQSVSRESRAASCRRSTDISITQSKLIKKKTEGPQLPNLRKCFEEARTKYLMESERKKKVMPPIYSSQIPRNQESTQKKQQRDIMKDPDSFGLRFFNNAYVEEIPRKNRNM